MFEIKPPYSEGPSGDRLMVVDEDRDVWLQYIGGMGSQPGACFKLVWRGQEISFDVHANSEFDEDGNEIIFRRIRNLGTSITAELKSKIKYWIAESESEKRERQ